MENKASFDGAINSISVRMSPLLIPGQSAYAEILVVSLHRSVLWPHTQCPAHLDNSIGQPDKQVLCMPKLAHAHSAHSRIKSTQPLHLFSLFA